MEKDDRESRELLKIDGFAEECRKGLEEIRNGGSVSLDDLEE